MSLRLQVAATSCTRVKRFFMATMGRTEDISKLAPGVERRTMPDGYYQ